LARGELTLEEAATILNISTHRVYRMIERKLLTGHQACKSAPWVIQRADIERLASGALSDSPSPDDRNQLSLKIP
jgi:excisionase family DNA binding protein